MEAVIHIVSDIVKSEFGFLLPTLSIIFIGGYLYKIFGDRIEEVREEGKMRSIVYMVLELIVLVSLVRILIFML